MTDKRAPLPEQQWGRCYQVARQTMAGMAEHLPSAKCEFFIQFRIEQ
jgi:hypothetical protein